MGVDDTYRTTHICTLLFARYSCREDRRALLLLHVYSCTWRSGGASTSARKTKTTAPTTHEEGDEGAVTGSTGTWARRIATKYNGATQAQAQGQAQHVLLFARHTATAKHARLRDRGGVQHVEHPAPEHPGRHHKPEERGGGCAARQRERARAAPLADDRDGDAPTPIQVRGSPLLLICLPRVRAPRAHHGAHE